MLSVNPLRFVQQWINARRHVWIKRHHPPQPAQLLDKRRIYILPTRACLGFVGLLLILILLAINYENNLIYGLTFLLISVLLISMIHTHNNLRGLRVEARGSELVSAGDKTRYRLYLRAPEHPVVALRLGYPGGDEYYLTLAAGEDQILELSAAEGVRGLHRAGILHLSSGYPMGLFRAWSYADLDQTSWIYPKAEAGGVLPSSPVHTDQGRLLGEGVQEFSGLSEYHPGMPLGRAAWATLARGLPLQVKEFTDLEGDSLWLSWSFWPELSVESRLSRLCYWVLRFEHESQAYGLEMPERSLEVGYGAAHQHSALELLARHGIAQEPDR